MSKKYKIVVSDTVAVQVKGALSDADGKPASFKFTLVCKRLNAEEFKSRMEGGESTTKDVMQEVTTGWNGQRLVLEEDGTPAEFCADALEALLDINGMANVCFVAYGKESGAHAKN